MPAKHRDTDALRIAERSRKAKDMRILGFTYDQISDELGVSISTVRKDLQRYMHDLPREHAEEYRQIQIAQLEMVLRNLTPRIRKLDYKAIDLYLKTVDRLSRLTGTNIPAEDNTGEQAARDDLAAMMAAIKGAAS